MDSNDIYEMNSAKKIRIGIYAKTEINQFHEFLNNHIFASAKVSTNFTTDISIINSDTTNYSQYNYIFYKCEYNQINDLDKPNIATEIKNILSQLTNPRNHLFLLMDGCEDLEIDDDGDLIFCDKNKNTVYDKFIQTLGKIENICNISRISIPIANAWKKIANDGSVVNLNDDEMNIITNKLIKNSKRDMADKKKEVRAMIKKLKIDDKLNECGFNEFNETVGKYFKLISQKKIVSQNYIYEFNKININFNTLNLQNILKEIYDINYLKNEMHDELIHQIDQILLSKLKNFYQKSCNLVVIEPKQLNHIDAYTYHKFLSTIMEIVREYNMSNIMEITKQEIGYTNKLIIDQHNKEMEKLTDLDKILSILEIFAARDKNNLPGLFDRIQNNSKIMVENMEKMDKWVFFIDKCSRIGIAKESLIKLLEQIIILKITYFSDVSKSNRNEFSTIYPQCLQVFLLPNLNKNFIFMKLYMLLVYTIRYSGKNIADLIKNIKYDDYKNLMLIENKLLELCCTNIEEPSQKINISDIKIMESFNEKKSASDVNNKFNKKNIKMTKKINDD